MSPGYADAWMTLGRINQAQARYDEAEKSFRNAIGANSDLAPAYFALAASLSHQQKASEAETVLRNAVQRFPKDVAGRLLLGSMLERQGKQWEAEVQYKIAYQLEPNNPMALNNLGYSMVERNERLEEALKMIQKAVNADPNNCSKAWGGLTSSSANLTKPSVG